MNGHFITKCVNCEEIVSQCRCLDKEKEVRPGACGPCRTKFILGKRISKEFKVYMEKGGQYPNETRSES